MHATQNTKKPPAFAPASLSRWTDNLLTGGKKPGADALQLAQYNATLDKPVLASLAKIQDALEGFDYKKGIVPHRGSTYLAVPLNGELKELRNSLHSSYKLQIESSEALQGETGLASDLAENEFSNLLSQIASRLKEGYGKVLGAGEQPAVLGDMERRFLGAYKKFSGCGPA